MQGEGADVLGRRIDPAAIAARRLKRQQHSDAGTIGEFLPEAAGGGAEEAAYAAIDRQSVGSVNPQVSLAQCMTAALAYQQDKFDRKCAWRSHGIVMMREE